MPFDVHLASWMASNAHHSIAFANCICLMPKRRLEDVVVVYVGVSFVGRSGQLLILHQFPLCCHTVDNSSYENLVDSNPGSLYRTRLTRKRCLLVWNSKCIPSRPQPSFSSCVSDLLEASSPPKQAQRRKRHWRVWHLKGNDDVDEPWKAFGANERVVGEIERSADIGVRAMLWNSRIGHERHGPIFARARKANGSH